MKNYESQKSPNYSPTQHENYRDSRGNLREMVVYAGRDHTEYRNANGNVRVEIHPKGWRF